jgi:diguanylate cyclase (GGDEF)-like protein/PAS domain S-box-containing protein
MPTSMELVPGQSSEKKNHLFKQVMDNLVDGVYFTDRERRITYWNQAAENLSGYLAEEVVGKSCDDNFLMGVDGSACLLCGGACPLRRTLEDGRPHRAEVYLHHKGGHKVPVEVRVSPIQDSNGEIVGAVEIFSDNSRHRALRDRAKELAKMAFLDPASQVGNRRYLEQQLSQQLSYYYKSGTQFGIILADLDQLKKINDSYGHVSGNASLVSVAKTLSSCLRASDVVGRWGGDEFLAILPGITRKILMNASEKCRTLVAESTVSVENGLQVAVTVSIGAAMVAPGDSSDSIFKRADERLYISKQSGRNRVSL